VNRVQEFDSTGTYQSNFGSEGTGDGQFFGIGGIAVAGDGTIYVTDNLNSRVEKFSASGSFQVTWGAPGSGPGQFDSPRGLDTDTDGYIYVADTNNDRIQKFGFGTPAQPMTWGQLKRHFGESKK